MTEEFAPRTNVATYEEPSIEVPEAFSVKDEGAANWVVRKIVEAREYAQRVQTWADAELRRAKREEEFFLLRFGRQLEEWARANLTTKRCSRKSIALPAGKLGFRSQPPRLDIVDEKGLLDWCRQNAPDAIILKESVAKRILLDHLKKTGELPIGSTVVAGREQFYIG